MHTNLVEWLKKRTTPTAFICDVKKGGKRPTAGSGPVRSSFPCRHRSSSPRSAVSCSTTAAGLAAAAAGATDDPHLLSFQFSVFPRSFLSWPAVSAAAL